MDTVVKIDMFNGKSRSGKDTAAEIFVEAGATKISFAEPIRKFIMEICGFETLEELDANKTTPMEILNWQTPRYAMQTLGTEWGRDTINPRLWTMLVKQKIERELAATGQCNYVVSDFRFGSEYYDTISFFPSPNIINVYEIIRPNNELALTGSLATHASESDLPSDIPRVTILNDSTRENYLEKIKSLL